MCICSVEWFVKPCDDCDCVILGASVCWRWRSRLLRKTPGEAAGKLPPQPHLATFPHSYQFQLQTFNITISPGVGNNYNNKQNRPRIPPQTPAHTPEGTAPDRSARTPKDHNPWLHHLARNHKGQGTCTITKLTPNNQVHMATFPYDYYQFQLFRHSALQHHHFPRTREQQ